MSLRVSSTAIFQQAISQLQRQQSEISRTQLELSTGRRIITAKDDPIGAGVGEAIDRSLAEIARWGDNATLVQNRLQREEEVLRQVGDRAHRLRELAIQANSAVHSADTLQGVVEELRLMREGLVQLANSTDGNGRFLFGGALDGTPPFVANAAGGFDYVGDQTQRRVEIGPELDVADADPGSEVFQRIRTGNGIVALREGPANTGTGMLSSTGFTDETLWDGRNYTITFNDLPGPPPVSSQWTITDDVTAAVIGTGPYTSGAPIDFMGVRLVLTGDPADGDTFTANPAPTRDIFAAVQELIDTIELPKTTPAQNASRENRFYSFLEDLDQITDSVIDKRASVGARLATIDLAADQQLADNEILRTTLSDVRDTDFNEAISRLSFQLQSLDAAQKSFLRVQDLSLFNSL